VFGEGFLHLVEQICSSSLNLSPYAFRCICNSNASCSSSKVVVLAHSPKKTRVGVLDSSYLLAQLLFYFHYFVDVFYPIYGANYSSCSKSNNDANFTHRKKELSDQSFIFLRGGSSSWSSLVPLISAMIWCEQPLPTYSTNPPVYHDFLTDFPRIDLLAGG
jgi:hypothetical protein